MKKIPAFAYYVIIAALLGGYIYFFERGPVKTDADKDKDKKTKVFTNYVADDIKEIKIENLATTITARKAPIVMDKSDKDVWSIKTPHEFKADDSTVHNVLNSVADLTPDSTVENPKDLGEFGLNTPTARCSYVSKTGTAFTILVGDKSATGAFTYIKTTLSNDVYFAQAYVIDNMTKPVNDYRDKTFFKTDGVLAQKVQVNYKGKTTVFEKDKNAVWNITQPIKVKADDQKVKDLLNAVNNLRIVDYADDHPANLAVYGLSQPHGSVQVWSSNSKTPDTILVGREKLKANQLFVKSGADPAVYLINSYFDKNIDIKPSDYRDKSMMKFDAGQVKSITVSRRGQVFAYTKDDKGQWTSEGRTKAQEEGNYLVSSLSNTVISDFASAKDVTGLKDPAYLIEVQLNTGEQRTYRFGNINKSSVYLASDKNKDVYLVPSNVISQFDVYYSQILTPVATSAPALK